MEFPIWSSQDTDGTGWTADTQEKKMRVLKEIFQNLQPGNQQKILKELDRIKH